MSALLDAMRDEVVECAATYRQAEVDHHVFGGYETCIRVDTSRKALDVALAKYRARAAIESPAPREPA